MGDFNHMAQNAALGIDFGHRHVNAILPVGANGCAATGQFGDIGELDVLGEGGAGQAKGQGRGEQDGVEIHGWFSPLGAGPLLAAGLAGGFIALVTWMQ